MCKILGILQHFTVAKLPKYHGILALSNLINVLLPRILYKKYKYKD